MKFLLIVALIGSAKAIETVGLHQQTPVQYGSQIGPVLYGALGEGGLVGESRTLPDEAGPKMSALPTSGLATVPKSLKHTQPLVYRPNPYVYIPAIGQVAKPEETVATNPFVYTSYKPKLVAQVLPPGYIPTIVAPARAPAPDRDRSPISEETDPKLVAQALALGYIPTLVAPARAPAPALEDIFGPKGGAIPEETDPLSLMEEIVAPARAPAPGGYIPKGGALPEGTEEISLDLLTQKKGINPFVFTASPYVYAHSMNPVHPSQVKPIVPHGFAYSFTLGHKNVPANLCKCADNWKCCYFNIPDAIGHSGQILLH